MFQLSAVRVRHYEFENPEDGTVLHVHPPKLEAVEIFNKVFTDKESTPKDMAGVTAQKPVTQTDNPQLSGQGWRGGSVRDHHAATKNCC